MTRSSLRACRWAFALLGAISVTVGCSYTSRTVESADQVSKQSSYLYAADGTLIRTFHAEENRSDVTLEQMPIILRNAVVAIEDERFYQHNGIDLRGIVRAARANAESGGVTEGGSTITQQYVKQALLHDSSQTAKRKLQEASLAIQLERHYSKDRILELYLNAIYFGNGAYGVAAASDQYFAKEVEDLTLPEAALLAALIQRPTADDPYDHPKSAKARRDLVLTRMQKDHYATAEEVAAAKATPLQLGSSTTPAAARYDAPYFVQQVQDWILSDPRFGATADARRKLLFEGGLRISTTVDLQAQAKAEAAMTKILPNPANADPDIPDVAIVSIEPSTGAVTAMVGGRDFFGNGQVAKLNLAMRKRQTGSSFKPLVLAEALTQGISPERTYSAPGCILLPAYDPKKPVCNYSDSESVASSTIVEGTVHSYNTLYVQLMLDVGPKKAVAMAAALGVRSPLQAVPSAVLGSNVVTPVDMASAYGTFANRGVHLDPVLVTQITRPDGTVLYRQDPHPKQVLEPDVADTVTAILQQVVQRGTGTAAQLDRPAAGKTGTADSHHDAWFVGYTPDLVTAVWVGFHAGSIPMEPPKTPIPVTGGSYPARIWHEYMQAVVAGTPVNQFHAPPGDAFGPDTVDTTTTTLPLDPNVLVPGGDPGTSDVGLPGPSTTSTTRVPGAGLSRVPSVTGMDKDSAAQALQAQGFSVVEHGRPGSGSPTGTVIFQSPAGGSLARTGSRVDISVAT